MLKYAPTLRGFIVGVALWLTVVSAVGCFGRDIGRIRIDPETGNEIVEKFGFPAKPGDANFVGPIDPSTDLTFQEGKRAAAAEYRASVKRIAHISYWLLIPAAILLLIASYLVPLIPTKLGLALGACVLIVPLAEYFLLTYGIISMDILAILLGIAVVCIIIPLVIWWVKARIQARGKELAAKDGHERDGAAVIVATNPDLFENRKEIAQLLVDAKKRVDGLGEAAKGKLAEIGVKL